MHKVGMIAVIASLIAGPALCQTSTRPAARGGETPIDHGPFTPQANQAYQGGGMILQGAPGAPPPAPEPTPPGETPRNMVRP